MKLNLKEMYEKFMTPQYIVLLLIMCVIMNLIIIVRQVTTTDSLVTIKTEHKQLVNEACDKLVKTYEERATMMAYRYLTTESFEHTSTRNIDSIPEDRILFVTLYDGTTKAVSYWDERGFLQSLIQPKDGNPIEHMPIENSAIKEIE